MSENYDVIVIGAGIAGISAAAELSAHGRTLVLEMEDQPGYHATGRSAAYFAPSYGNRVIRGITHASEHFFRKPPEGFCETELIQARSAVFISRQDQRNFHEALKKEQSGLEELDGTGLRQRVPLLKESYANSALWDDRGGDIEVSTLLQGYLKLFRQRGGTLCTARPVSSLNWDRGNWQIQAGQESFSAPVVINAAGAWADEIAQLAGLEQLKLVPKRRTVVLIDKPAELDTKDLPLVIDVEEEFYFKPDAGQLLLSPANEDPSEPCDCRPEELEIAIAVDRFETATGIEVQKINHSWAGLRTFAPDKTFVAGFDPRCEGFFWLAAQGGYGVQSAPGMAQLACSLVTGVSPAKGFSAVLEYREDVSPLRLIS